MKYIRTEYNIYNTSELIKCEDKRFPDGWFTKSGVPLIAIKQGGTMEELGDAYVIVPKDGKSKPYTVNTLSVFDDFEDVLRHNDIYLSIWVGALLKPTAKMNDKGELELYYD